MTTKAGREVPRLRGYQDFTSPDNKAGLTMHIVQNGEGVESSFRIPGHMSGWRSPKVTGAHPGAVATALATVTGHGALALAKAPAMLKQSSTEYYDLVPVDTDVRATARVAGKRGDGEVVMVGEITDAAGQVLASCTATYTLYTAQDLSRYAMCADPAIGEIYQALGKA